MRYPRILSLTILLVLLPASIACSIAASPARGDSTLKTGKNLPGKVLIVIEHAVTDTVVDIGPAGDSLGDLLAFGNPIFDADNTQEVGRDQGYCVRTNVGESWECNLTVILDQGSITVEGPFYDDLRDSQFAITGGIGAYGNSRGEMTLHARNEAGTEFDFVFHIIG